MVLHLISRRSWVNGFGGPVFSGWMWLCWILFNFRVLCCVQHTFDFVICPLLVGASIRCHVTPGGTPFHAAPRCPPRSCPFLGRRAPVTRVSACPHRHGSATSQKGSFFFPRVTEQLRTFEATKPLERLEPTLECRARFFEAKDGEVRETFGGAAAAGAAETPQDGSICLFSQPASGST